LPCVYDLVDALSLNMTRRGQLDRSPLGLLAHREGHLLAGVERQLCAQAAGIAVCSASDRAAIGDPRLTLVANGVDLDAFPFVAITAGARVCLSAPRLLSNVTRLPGLPSR
jgi:hypothetical protein